ncbi:MAG TPA: DUF2987 domain-containing protein [Aliidongia sp.]|uniref:DUF2987 domain-containing protein n=1 Tax=Aliidongia sp. TaxID=1914230 RepID=UPI002DDD1B2D|nr:DUF2987 domain-containing protein [Aliidongia sp.]HEV2676000.1 DUF2987 domain-containing protein [Aliidongia sp.]
MKTTRLVTRRTFGAGLAALLTVGPFAGPAWAADEFASLPYRTLVDGITTFLNVPQDQRDRLALIQSLHPDGGNLVARPLTMTVRAKAGPIDVQVGDDNSFALPLSDQLKDENPTVVTNQPKGTLSLQVGVRILLPQTTHYAYREFAEGISQANAMTKRFAGMMWLFSKTADSLILRFHRPERQMLRIAAADGALTLIADESGTIFVRLDKKLVEENPMMELSEPALDALPALSR